jgi:hypothetical protein
VILNNWSYPKTIRRYRVVVFFIRLLAQAAFGSQSNKKDQPISSAGLCAQDRIRTCTPVKALPPQSSVSTNFTTWANRGANIDICLVITNVAAEYLLNTALSCITHISPYLAQKIALYECGF